MGDLDTTAGLPRTHNRLFHPDGVSDFLSDKIPGRLANWFSCNRLYATKFKDLRNPLIFTYAIFLIVRQTDE